MEGVYHHWYTPFMQKPTLLPIGLTADYFLTRLGKKPSHRTLRRWATDGRDGHRLRVVRISGGWWTREEWVQEFLSQLSRAVESQPRSKRAARAMAALQKRIKQKPAGVGRPGKMAHGPSTPPGVSRQGQ